MNRKLSAGSEHVNKIYEQAALLNVDVIELRYLNPNGVPYYSFREIIGYQVPNITGHYGRTISDRYNPDGSPAEVDAQWIDGTLKFCPDDAGNSWGYVFDTPHNRHLIKTSLSTGWYTIVDKRIKDEIINEAKEENIPTDIVAKAEINIKKSRTERIADNTIAKQTDRIKELEAELERHRQTLKEATGEKIILSSQRLAGKKIDKNRMNQLQGTNQ